jgi:hypothetical protein
MCICFSSLVTCQQDGDSPAFSTSESNLVRCFDAARAAEVAGANISRLSDTLNSASALLADAEREYSMGNYANAQSLTAQSQNLLRNFVTDANSLQVAATRNRSIDFLVNVVGSVFGTISVIAVSIVVWRLLKKKYRGSAGLSIESAAV